MLMENFQVGRPVGTGHSRPNDVIRLRKALRETGHGSSPPEPSGVYDSSLNSTIKRFQGDYGLEPDGVVMPDGPTARMLDLALTAQRQGGDDGQAQLHQIVGAIRDAGLKPGAPPPGDKRPIVFTDANGNIASPDRLTEIVNRPSQLPVGRRTGETQIAFVPAIAAGIAGADAAWNAIAALLGITIGVTGAATVREAIKNKAPANQKPTPGPRTPNDANGARRTIDAEANTSILPGTPLNRPLHIPTPPLTHPPVPHDNEPETFPAEGPKFPTHTATPINQPKLPQILIFPDLSGSLPDTTIVHSDRGDDNTKRQILAAQIHFQRQHPDWKHVSGGYNLKGKDLKNGTFDIRDLAEVKESAIKGPGWAFLDEKDRHGDGRPGSRFPDILYETPEGKLVAINTVDVDGNGQITQRELDAAESMRRQGITVYLIKKTHQMKQL